MRDSQPDIADEGMLAEWTDKQRLFVDKYFELGLNGTRAAIAAGYSKKTARQTASENLSKPYIREEVERRLSDQAMGKNEVLTRLAEFGRGDIRDFATISSGKALAAHPNGNVVKKFKRTITTTVYAETGKTVKEERIELEVYSAPDAIVQIGRYHKLFTDNMDMTSGGDKISAPQVFLPSVDPE